MDMRTYFELRRLGVAAYKAFFICKAAAAAREAYEKAEATPREAYRQASRAALYGRDILSGPTYAREAAAQEAAAQEVYERAHAPMWEAYRRALAAAFSAVSVEPVELAE